MSCLPLTVSFWHFLTVSEKTSRLIVVIKLCFYCLFAEKLWRIWEAMLHFNGSAFLIYFYFVQVLWSIFEHRKQLNHFYEFIKLLQFFILVFAFIICFVQNGLIRTRTFTVQNFKTSQCGSRHTLIHNFC